MSPHCSALGRREPFLEATKPRSMCPTPKDAAGSARPRVSNIWSQVLARLQTPGLSTLSANSNTPGSCDNQNAPGQVEPLSVGGSGGRVQCRPVAIWWEVSVLCSVVHGAALELASARLILPVTQPAKVPSLPKCRAGLGCRIGHKPGLERTGPRSAAAIPCHVWAFWRIDVPSL